MKWNKLISIITISAITIAGCKKFVDVNLPINQLNTESAFATDSKANSAMRGIYSSMHSTLFSSGPFTVVLSPYLGIYSDELEKTSISGDQQLYFENNVGAENGINNGIWTKMYATIYQANNAYMNLEKSQGVSPVGKERMMGEARFLRAWNYFYLVNMYDSVPLVTSPDYLVNALLPRTAPAKVYDLIREDLVYAQTHAGDLFTTLGSRGRANQWAATALLARVQLYTQNWADAEKQATTVIESGYFKMDPLDSSFVASSRELIFGIANPGTNFYTNEAFTNIGTGTNPNYRFSSYTNDAFEATDARLTKWTKIGANGFRGPAKYKTFSNTQANAKKEITPMFRLAEQYLIRAEARAMQNNLSGAIADIDTVRKRAALPLVSVTNPGISKDDLLKAIMKERQTELFGELGHRWFDLKRTGQAQAVLSVRKAKWRQEAILFPIPLRERQTNPNLGQNKGYQ